MKKLVILIMLLGMFSFELPIGVDSGPERCSNRMRTSAGPERCSNRIVVSPVGPERCSGRFNSITAPGPESCSRRPR